MPPRFRICPICQQGFGTASLNIHIPQCYEKSLKRWRLNPIGPMPVMPSINTPPRQGGKQMMTDSARGNGVIGARSLRQQATLAGLQEYSEGNMNLHPCSRCGRSFLFDRISYHESVCKGDIKRRVFDSSKQRAVEGSSGGGEFGISFGKKKGMKRISSNTSAPAGVPRTHWREQHKEFIEAIRAARRGEATSRAMWGEPLAKEPPRALKRNNTRRAPPFVTRQQKGMQIRQQRTSQPIEANFTRPAPTARRAPPRRSFGGAFGGGGERFTGGGFGGGGGGGKIINDNTTSLGMLQAFGRA